MTDLSTSVITDDTWTSIHMDDQLDLVWISSLFPTKEPSKRQEWLSILRDQEFETVGDLVPLGDGDWQRLGLPMMVQSRMRSAVMKAAQDKMEKEKEVEKEMNVEMKIESSVPKIAQIDMIVLDISGSMKASSAIDSLKTREDMSKVLFHTMVDKLVGLEMNHAVGLLSFGANLHPIPITREYERFHDHLGRMDAREGSTMLYDAILEAAKEALRYVHTSPDVVIDGEEKTRIRIFALTDGEDNASKQAAWQVAQFLQHADIILDAFPLAGDNATLRAMASATGGFCLRVSSEQQGLALFEREAVLHVGSRETLPSPPRPINTLLDLTALEGSAVVVEDVQVAVPRAMAQPVLSVSEALSKVEKLTDNKPNSAALRRVMKEFRDFTSDSVPGWMAFVGADDPMIWKAILQGPSASPYEGGNWLLSVQFPTDYPFKPPRVRFITRIYHCNISNDGAVCLDVLKDHWSPALSISKIFQSISSLLEDPNPDDALDAFKAQVYRTDHSRYISELKQAVVKYASADIPDLLASISGTSK